MSRVSTEEFIGSFDEVTRRAESEIVTITVEGHDKLVLMSFEEFERLNGRGAEGSATSSATSTEVELPAAWAALRHTVLFVADDIAEPIDEDWAALR